MNTYSTQPATEAYVDPNISSNTAYYTSRKKSIPLALHRFLQFASAVLVMSLLAYAVNDYNFHGSKKTNFALAVGVIGTFYNLIVFALCLLIPQIVLAGVYMTAEIIMCLLWLCAFIVLAKAQGSHSCHNKTVSIYDPAYGSPESFSETGGQYNPFTNRYTNDGYSKPCRSAKAAIAFAGLNFVLFVLSCIVLGFYVLKPIREQYGSSGQFKTGSFLGTQLDRLSGLFLSRAIPQTVAPHSEYYEGAVAPDIESTTATAPVAAADQTATTGAPGQGAYVEQQTTSTNVTSHTYNQEKLSDSLPSNYDDGSTSGRR